MKYTNWRKKGLILIFLVAGFYAFAQSNFTEFSTKSHKIQNTGMYVLGSWAVLNMSTGLYGWSKYQGDRQYFYQMNFFWNVVNLSIAGVALYNIYATDVLSLSNETILSDHQKMERTLLINVGLDVGYLATGYFLAKRSQHAKRYVNLLKGYGNSLVLQGAFLFGFDIILWSIMRSSRMQRLDHINLSAVHDKFLLNYTWNF